MPTIVAPAGLGTAIAGRLRPALAGLVAMAALAACGLGAPVESGLALPEPTCGGARVEIPGALACERLVEIAVEHLEQEVPQQLDRGVVAVTVELQGCPANEVPPQLDCTDVQFVQLVTLTFGPSVEGGPIEPSLSVGLDPVTGRVLGIVNPLIQ